MKKSAWVRAVLVGGVMLSATLAVTAPARPASACGMAIRAAREAVDSSSQHVAEAEQSLSEGRMSTAAIQAIRAFPALKIIKPGTLPLADRALRIVALASTRSDGNIAVNGFQSGTESDRTKNLEWSVKVLRNLNAKRPNNPSLQTDLGEALAKLPGSQEEAKGILDRLAAKDLLTSAEGYAALARLRSGSDETAARDEAVKRCEGMSKTPKACAVPSSAPPVVAVASRT